MEIVTPEGSWLGTADFTRVGLDVGTSEGIVLGSTLGTSEGLMDLLGINDGK